MPLTRTLKLLGRKIGFEVLRHTSVSDRWDVLVFLANKYGVDTVLDIGANEGQFAERLMLSGWNKRIRSFEALSTAHEKVSARAKSHARWEVAPKVAVGRERGSAMINIAGNSQSSSLLPMLDRHQEAAPDSAYVATEQVDVVPLVDLLAAEAGAHRYLLKLDVQGFELEVLRGAGPILDRCPIVFCEMSLQPLYAGEPLFTTLGEALIGLGYRCAGIYPGFFETDTREVLQADGVFLRD